MAIALTVLNAPNGADNTQRRTILEGTATLSGNYTAGGETINWLSLKDVAGNNILLDTLQSSPVWTTFQMDTPAATALLLIPVFNYTTGKLQFYDSSTGAELAAGAYPNGYLGTAKLRFKAEFPVAI